MTSFESPKKQQMVDQHLLISSTACVFLFLFLDLAATWPGLGWKSGSSESESLSGEEGGVEGGGGEGARGKKWGIVGAREDFFRWYTWLQG